MDELGLVRDLYAEPAAATAGETGDARARLDALMTSRRRWRHARWAVPGLGLAAAATALAVVVSQSADPPARTGPGAAPTPAGKVLLAAAGSSARTPLKSGTYWLTHLQTGRATVVQGHYGPYVVEERRETKDWTNATGAGRGGSTTHYFAGRPLGTRPVAAANIAAWKRDGSPSHWDIPAAGHPPWRISAKPGSWSVNKEETAFGSAFNDGSPSRLRASGRPGPAARLLPGPHPGRPGDTAGLAVRRPVALRRRRVPADGRARAAGGTRRGVPDARRPARRTRGGRGHRPAGAPGRRGGDGGRAGDERPARHRAAWKAPAHATELPG